MENQYNCVIEFDHCAGMELSDT